MQAWQEIGSDRSYPRTSRGTLASVLAKALSLRTTILAQHEDLSFTNLEEEKKYN